MVKYNISGTGRVDLQVLFLLVCLSCGCVAGLVPGVRSSRKRFGKTGNRFGGPSISDSSCLSLDLLKSSSTNSTVLSQISFQHWSPGVFVCFKFFYTSKAAAPGMLMCCLQVLCRAVQISSLGVGGLGGNMLEICGTTNVRSSCSCLSCCWSLTPAVKKTVAIIYTEL